LTVNPIALTTAISYVQGADATPQSPQTSVSVTFPAVQTAGNLNIIVVGWNDSTATVSTITDKSGNTYTRAVGPTVQSGIASQSIYYAKNIAAAAAGGNSVNVKFSSAAASPDIRILEYKGADPNSPVDVTAANSGNSATSSSGAATTTNATDLVFGANLVQTTTTGPASGFTSRLLTSPDGDIAEDQTVTAIGSYSATAPLNSGRWIMQMVAFRTPVSGSDTTPPTAPANLKAAASGAQINLTWTASTDNVGVTGYRVERCQGAGCSNFAQIATPITTSYSDTSLTANTTYSYRVRASDSAGNLSPYSNIVSATTTSATATITYIQGAYDTPQSPQTKVSVPFPAAQTAGGLNVVVVGWNDGTATVSTVTDKSGNIYTRAVGPTVQSGFGSQSIYYAKNIVAAAAGANSVTVTFSSAAAYPDIRILEYKGADPNAPVDVTAASSGNSVTSGSGSVTTTNATDLIFGANLVQTTTTGSASGFTKRLLTSPDGDIAEDKMVNAIGSYSATALLSSGQWIMQMVAFRAP
jgi:nitrogen fixation protein FixH